MENIKHGQVQSQICREIDEIPLRGARNSTKL